MKKRIVGILLSVATVFVSASPAVFATAKVSCTSASERLLAVVLGAPGDAVAVFTLAGPVLDQASGAGPGVRVYDLNTLHLWDCTGRGGCHAAEGQVRLNGPVSSTMGATFSGSLILPKKDGVEFVAHVEDKTPVCQP
jgi:hypothetical protein